MSPAFFSSPLAVQLLVLSFGGCSTCSGRYPVTRTAELPELYSQSLFMSVSHIYMTVTHSPVARAERKDAMRNRSLTSLRVLDLLRFALLSGSDRFCTLLRSDRKSLKPYFEIDSYDSLA